MAAFEKAITMKDMRLRAKRRRSRLVCFPEGQYGNMKYHCVPEADLRWRIDNSDYWLLSGEAKEKSHKGLSLCGFM
jgi:hypothetical protein